MFKNYAPDLDISCELNTEIQASQAHLLVNKQHIIAPKLKLRIFGIPEYGPTDALCNNERSVVKNSSKIKSTRKRNILLLPAMWFDGPWLVVSYERDGLILMRIQLMPSLNRLVKEHTSLKIGLVTFDDNLQG